MIYVFLKNNNYKNIFFNEGVLSPWWLTALNYSNLKNKNEKNFL